MAVLPKRVYLQTGPKSVWEFICKTRCQECFAIILTRNKNVFARSKCWNICPRDQSRVDWLGIYFISCRYNNKGIASYYVTISAYQYWVNIIMSIEWLLIILKRHWSMYHYGKDNNDAVRLAYVWLITKCCYRALDANQTYGQWVGEPRCWTDPQWECYMGES